MFLSKQLYRSLLLIIMFGFSANQGISQVELETQIIDTFPTPGPSPQGLAWDGDYLYLADDTTDTIYKIDPLDGSVLLLFDSPGPEPKGITSDTTHIWCLDDSLRHIYKLDKDNGAVLDSIPFPAEFDYLPLEDIPFYGVTWDGQYFYVNFEAGWSSQIIRMDVENDRVSHLRFTSGTSRDLCYDGVYIWNCCDNRGYSQGWVVQYRLNGYKLDRFYTPGFYPKGVAYDGEYFWISDDDTDSLYQIQVLPSSIENLDINLHDVPHAYLLHQNYPNPFNCSTTITYEIRNPSEVYLTIFDLTGKEVKKLVKKYQTTGLYQVVWDGKDKHGKEVSSGAYLSVLMSGDFTKTRTMFLVK